MRTVLVVILLLATLGCDANKDANAGNAGNSQDASDRVSPEPAGAVADPIPQTVGRFVIVHSPQVERDTILLDTATGKTWTAVEMDYLKNDPLAWVPMPQLNSGEEHTAFDAAHELKPEGKKGTLPKAEGSIDASTTNQAGQN